MPDGVKCAATGGSPAAVPLSAAGRCVLSRVARGTFYLGAVAQRRRRPRGARAFAFWFFGASIFQIDHSTRGTHTQPLRNRK